jgi:hypothetical protein
MLIEKRRFLTWIWHTNAISFSLRKIYLDAIDNNFHIGFKRIVYANQTKDLSPHPDALFSQCSSTVRNEIRKAERLQCRYHTSQEPKQFLPILNATANAKGLYKKTVKTFATKPDSIFSYSQLNESIAACHYYLIDMEESTAILLFSGSARYLTKDDQERKNITFAHRFLLFQDFLMLKEKGIGLIKFGKLNLDNSGNPASASKFRFGFNCSSHLSYNYYPWGYYILNKIREKLKSERFS